MSDNNPQQPWWKQGVVYQIYPRSFNDSNGDGIGDLQGIIDRLDYLNDGTEKSLGVDAIWISPYYPSPMKDFGYDIADYTDVDAMFGDLATFDRLVEEAHKRGIKVIVDYVPNHSSDQHAWFIESRSSRDNPKRDWYYWRDPRPDGSRPNNWGTLFGGLAWTLDETTGQYYLHLFDPSQPDLNWRNPEVKAVMLDVLRFWLDRGVDGFRMDVVYIIWKHPDLPDQPEIPGATGRGPDDNFSRQEQIYAYNYDGIHDVMKEIRGVIDEYPDKVAIGELWLPLEERMLYYGAAPGDEFHLPFNFDLIGGFDWTRVAPLDAAHVRALVDAYEAAAPSHGWPNYVLGSHDVSRLATRLGSEARARVAAMLLLTLRGTPTLYQGDEIGMTNGVIPPEKVQDPQGKLIGAAHSRDQCRIPMQWSTADYAGFSTVEPWLPVNMDYPSRNVATLSDDPGSILSLYRKLLWMRKRTSALSIGDYTPVDSPDGTYVYWRTDGDEQRLIALNFTGEPQTITLAADGTILLSTYLDREEAVSGAFELRGDEGVVVTIGEKSQTIVG